MLLAVVVLLMLVPAFTHIVGYDFASQLGLADPAAYGFSAGAPAYPELVGIASGSPVIAAVTIIGFTIGMAVWLPQTIMLVSRNMFAWSFDRVVPERLSYVDRRSRSPIVAIGVMLVVSIASTAVYAFTDWLSSLSALLGLSLPLLVTAISGTLLPFRQPALVENSPYSRRIGGVPMLTLVGSLATLPATDLLMSKLQIVALNAKDRSDLYALLEGCDVRDGDHRSIEPDRVATLTGRDWGLHHTFELNLGRLREGLASAEAPPALSVPIDAIAEAMERAPKTRAWKLRARIGERKRWYEDPEEVDRTTEAG